MNSGPFITTVRQPGAGKLLETLKFFAIALSLIVLPGGCVSKSKAQLQAQMAYLAGQRDGLKQAHQQSLSGPSVTFIGPVNNSVVKWTEGLTLGQALVTAVYTSTADPAKIIIRRNNGEIQFDPKRLLQGEDLPLQPGDIIGLRQ